MSPLVFLFAGSVSDVSPSTDRFVPDVLRISWSWTAGPTMSAIKAKYVYEIIKNKHGEHGLNETI